MDFIETIEEKNDSKNDLPSVMENKIEETTGDRLIEKLPVDTPAKDVTGSKSASEIETVSETVVVSETEVVSEIEISENKMPTDTANNDDD